MLQKFKSLKKKKYLIPSAIAIAAIGVLNLIFLNATSPGDLGTSRLTLTPADGVPAGSQFLGIGGSSNAYRSGDWVYKVHNYRDPVEVREMLVLHNAIAEKIPSIPAYEQVGPHTLRQPFAAGLTFDELSSAAKTTADAQMRNFDAELAKTTGKVLTGRPKPIERPYILPSGNYMMVDAANQNPVDFRFNPDGTIKTAFDPLTILSKAEGADWFEGEKVSRVRPNITTDLPIDANDPKLTRLPSTAPGVPGLGTLRAVGILPAALTIAQVGIISNELKKDLNAAVTPAQTNAAHLRAARDLLLMVGMGAAGTVGLLAISAMNPMAGAVAGIWLLGNGLVDVGSYISAEFSLSDLGGWNLINGTQQPVDSSNPNVSKLQAYQRDALQQALKRADENSGQSHTSIYTMATVAIKSDPTYQEFFYSPPTKDSNNLRSGFFRTKSEAHVMMAFQTLANLDAKSRKWNLTTGLTETEKTFANAELIILAGLKSEIITVQRITGRRYNYPKKLEDKVLATARQARLTLPGILGTQTVPIVVSPPAAGYGFARIDRHIGGVDLTPYFEPLNSPSYESPRQILADRVGSVVVRVVDPGSIGAENIAILEGTGPRLTYYQNGVSVNTDPWSGSRYQPPSMEFPGYEGGVFNVQPPKGP